MATDVLRIDVHDYEKADAPRLVCSFFWSEAAGLSCSSPRHLARLVEQGIYAPTLDRRAFPNDGRIFFDLLPDHFSGSFLRASEPRPVSREK